MKITFFASLERNFSIDRYTKELSANFPSHVTTRVVRPEISDGLRGKIYDGVTTTSIERKVRFLNGLSLRLEQRGYPLVVKLHPETYGATWLPSPGNIRYVRDLDLGPLIQEAHACLGFDSTLVIPAIIARPTMLFQLSESNLITNAREFGVATVVRGLECSNEQLSALLDAEERSAEQLERFTECFAHSADGNATKRLANALREPVL